jgi:hypothetical protein
VRAIGQDLSILGSIEHRNPVVLHDDDGVGMVVSDGEYLRVEALEVDAKFIDS